MDKPSVYLDTTIISAYWYAGSDLASFARRLKTREWWELERPHFAVWTSNVSELADEILAAGVVPENKPRDALQMALSAAHETDYLLSWNYAHLVNPVAQARLDSICQDRSLKSPLLVSPETIPKTSLGQNIRRRQP